jgi:hypothetical protein
MLVPSAMTSALNEYVAEFHNHRKTTPSWKWTSLDQFADSARIDPNSKGPKAVSWLGVFDVAIRSQPIGTRKNNAKKPRTKTTNARVSNVAGST